MILIPISQLDEWLIKVCNKCKIATNLEAVLSSYHYVRRKLKIVYYCLLRPFLVIKFVMRSKTLLAKKNQTSNEFCLTRRKDL